MADTFEKDWVDTNISGALAIEYRPVNGTGLTECHFHTLSQ